MKKISTIAMVMVAVFAVMASLAQAGDKVQFSVNSVYSGAVATASSPEIYGYIDSVYLDIPTMETWTGLVSFVTATTKEIVYSNTITADDIKRPVAERTLTKGSTATNVADRFYLFDEKLNVRVTVTSTGMVLKTLPVLIRVTDR